MYLLNIVRFFELLPLGMIPRKNDLVLGIIFYFERVIYCYITVLGLLKLFLGRALFIFSNLLLGVLVWVVDPIFEGLLLYELGPCCAIASLYYFSKHSELFLFLFRSGILLTVVKALFSHLPGSFLPLVMVAKLVSFLDQC